MATFTVNGRSVSPDVPDDTPLLWVLRDSLQMTGTKFGCGQALCGACTIHIEGAPGRACVTPVGAVNGLKITTIEAMEPTASARWFRPRGKNWMWCSAAIASQARS